MSRYHAPVMGGEVLRYLAPSSAGFYLDGTVGGGGHTRLILEACDDCRVLAVDRDPEALEAAREALEDFRGRVRFLRERFDRAPLDPEVRDRGLDGALLDLGVSSHQIDQDRRGFTFRPGVQLDMRMAPESRDARGLLAEATEDGLARIFREYAEEPRGRRLAREIVKRRSTEPLRTSDDLVAALTVALGRSPSVKEKARIFQAVRIAVNDELEVLRSGLPAIRDVLRDGGVMVVIAYHSLEDRATKRAFRAWSRSCVCPPELPACVCRGVALGETLTRKVVRPSEEEVESNPRARSARLRAWRRAA
ncbi:MAG: 16S rRNA (cytosine(1402)-N(4))-methyltransferase RsmH [Longimicrobiales bacterium]|nr:16S rRNA (cytosine(1402)-N(4))-methyltransferase RsmH [Longimicrobiales bacterium]